MKCLLRAVMRSMTWLARRTVPGDAAKLPTGSPFSALEAMKRAQRTVIILALLTTPALAISPQRLQVAPGGHWIQRQNGESVTVCGAGDPENFFYRGTRNTNGTRQSDGEQDEIIADLIAGGSNAIYIIAYDVPDGGSSARPWTCSGDGSTGCDEDSDCSGVGGTCVLDADILTQWDGWLTTLDAAGIVTFLFFMDDGGCAPMFTCNDGTLNAAETAFIDGMVTKFEHLDNLIWVVAEEYAEAFSDAEAAAWAARIRAQDDYDHPILQHPNSNPPFYPWPTDTNQDGWAAQYNSSHVADHGLNTMFNTLWSESAAAASPWTVVLSEIGSAATGVGVNMRTKVWDVLMGGGWGYLVHGWYSNNCSGSCSGATSCCPNGPPAEDHAVCRDTIEFFSRVDHLAMKPDNSRKSGSTAFALVDDVGRRYVAYAHTYSTNMGLSSVAAGAYDVYWYSPSSAQTATETLTHGGGTVTLVRPGSISGSELAFALTPTSSVLGAAAAALSPGQWATISNSANCANLFEGGGSTKGIMEYSQELQFDPVTDRVYFAGSADPNNCGDCGKFVYYDVKTNSCAELSNPPWLTTDSPKHVYDELWFDPLHRVFGRLDPDEHEKWNIDTGVWTTGSAAGSSLLGNPGRGRCVAEWFPARSRVITGCYNASNGKDLAEYNPADNSWAALPTAGAFDKLHNHLECSHLGWCIYGGGDSTAIFKRLEANGTIGATVSPPSSCHNGGVSQKSTGPGALLVEDPASGEILLMHDAEKFCSFNGTSWTVLDPNNPYLNSSENGGAGDSWLAGAASLGKYGVVGVFKRFNGTPGSFAIYLYKHAGSSSGAECGNGTREPGEVCDGTDLAGATCASVSGEGWTGELACNAECDGFETSDCSGPSVPEGGCDTESGLAGRDDLLLCEPWDEATWWDGSGAAWKNSSRGVIEGTPSTSSRCNGAGVTQPAELGHSEIVSEAEAGVPCISGDCLRVWLCDEDGGNLSVKWFMDTDEAWMRYYLYLDKGWTPFGLNGEDGGKWPGLADERITSDPDGQCGNGGDYPDGTSPECWSARSLFTACQPSSTDNCNGSGLPDKSGANTRTGGYIYAGGYHGACGSSTGIPAYADGEDAAVYGCGTTCTSDSNPYGMDCGREVDTGIPRADNNFGMLVPGEWNSIEIHVAMNSEGGNDGKLQYWINGNLAWSKTNMLWETPTSPRDLSVKTVWVNVFQGGSADSTHDKFIVLDQLVIASGGQIGAFGADPGEDTPPAAPSGLQVK